MSFAKTKRLRNLGDIVDIVLGDKFIVAQKENGLIEVYDAEFNLISAKTFTNVEKVNANSRVILIRKDGSVDFFDKWLNFEFSRGLTI